MNNQKGFANIILIVLVVILAGAVGYFAFVKKSEPVAQQPTLPVTTQTPTLQQPSPTPVSETAPTDTTPSINTQETQELSTSSKQTQNLKEMGYGNGYSETVCSIRKPDETILSCDNVKISYSDPWILEWSNGDKGAKGDKDILIYLKLAFSKDPFAAKIMFSGDHSTSGTNIDVLKNTDKDIFLKDWRSITIDGVTGWQREMRSKNWVVDGYILDGPSHTLRQILLQSGDTIYQIYSVYKNVDEENEIDKVISSIVWK